MESGIADLAEVQQEVAAGGLVNLRWQGVFDGTSARDDGEVHAWLDAQTVVSATGVRHGPTGSAANAPCRP